MENRRIKLALCRVLAVLPMVFCFAALADSPARKPKALVVMLDGMRADGVENALTPTLQMLKEGKWQPGYRCAWTLTASTIRDAITVSAPNHVSIATGVTAKKTKVRNNGQMKRCDYTKWPTWLVRVVDAYPEKKALFMFSWMEDHQLNPDRRVEFVGAPDPKNAEDMPKRLAAPDCPDAVMWFINCPDSGGHWGGFYPYSVFHLHYVNFADTAIGGALRAIASRPTFAEEDWMIIVVSDHGGHGRWHGAMSGHCWTVPLLVTGRNVKQGRIPGMAHDYDVAPTALAHFGLDVSAMNLDGKVRGAETVQDPPRALTDGLVAYVPFDGKKAENRVAGGPKAVLCGATKVAEKGGYLFGCLRLAADKDGRAGVRLEGSEKLTFENGADFAMTLWVRMTDRPDGDPAIVSNKDWEKGSNPGIVLISAKKISSVRSPGISLNGALSGPKGKKRFDLGPYDIKKGEWVFYAATRGADGVVRLYEGGRDGYLYCIADDVSSLKLKSGLPFYIGQDGTGRYPKTMKGDIDEFALWTRGLAHEDVRRIYEAGRKGVQLGELLK